MKRATLHTDGACSGNPGPSGIGYVIELEGATYEHSAHIGEATNNVAEYRALIEALREARRLGALEVRALLDAELLVKQVKGQYKVKHPGLKPLHQETVELASGFKRFSIEHIPREENQRADALARSGAKASADEAAPAERKLF